MIPIQHLRAIFKKKSELSSKADLLRLLHETWHEMSQDTIRKLIKSMPKRAHAFNNAKGMSIKY